MVSLTMKTWWIAHCEDCMEAKHIFVNDPIMTMAYLGDYSSQIRQFMDRHSACSLRLISQDEDLDKLWDQGYLNSDLRFEKKDREVLGELYLKEDWHTIWETMFNETK